MERDLPQPWFIYIVPIYISSTCSQYAFTQTCKGSKYKFGNHLFGVLNELEVRLQFILYNNIHK